MNNKKNINESWALKRSDDHEIVPQDGDQAPAPRIMDEIRGSAPDAGILGRWRLAKTENDAAVKKLQVVRQTEVDLLKQQAEAAKKESEVFYNGKASALAEQMKTYVQNKLNESLAERSDNRNALLHDAYVKAADRVDAIANDPRLPDVLKEKAIQAVQKELETLEESIKNDVLARRHGLI